MKRKAKEAIHTTASNFVHSQKDPTLFQHSILHVEFLMVLHRWVIKIAFIAAAASDHEKKKYGKKIYRNKRTNAILCAPRKTVPQ